MTGVTTIWHYEKSDDADTAQRRTEELTEVAAALDLSETDRVIKETAKGEKTRAKDRSGMGKMNESV